MPARRPLLLGAGAALCLVAVVGWRWYQTHNQTPDLDFDTRVTRPAYAATHPLVLIDAGHHNFHTANGRYRPFAEMLRHDGYAVEPTTRPFTDRRGLDSARVLVIANAMGSWLPRGARAARPAFASDEIAAVTQWVESGGSLLLVADHYPAGEAASAFARALGVQMNGGYLLDERHAEPTTKNPTWIVYDEARLGRHAILDGRDSSERVHRVVAFTGQSLSVPPGAAALLLSDSSAFNSSPTNGAETSARGQAQAVALRVGRGRVVVVGEAAMLTAQVAGGRLRFGMSWPGTDDRQFTLNVMHWLSGLLEP